MKNKKKVKQIITIISDILFIIALLILVELCYTVYKGSVPGVFGYKALRVVSSSMEPLLVEGDCILIKATKPEEVEVGDVITFYSTDPMLDGYLNTHRVIGVSCDEAGNYLYTTKGDDNMYEDYYPAIGENLLGVYKRHLPFGEAITFLFELLSDRLVYFVVMMLPVLFCLIESIVSLISTLVDVFSKD